jgi:hypothetical protein
MIALAFFAIALLAAFFSFGRGLRAVRAKRHLRLAIAEDFNSDPCLRKHMRALLSHDLSDAEMTELLTKIQRRLEKLNATDRLLLGPGLMQNSRRGSNRFARDVLAIGLAKMADADTKSEALV